MFSRISRYRKQPDLVTVDARGRTLASKSLRPTPKVSGDFQHIVEEIDRLDHLAQKYYQQPRTWWHICDANPALLSPRALLGHEPLVTAQFPLTWEGPDPPWSDLLAVLGQTLGVEAARMGTPEQDHPEVAYLDGAPDFPITTPADLSVLQGVAAYLREGTPLAARQSAEQLVALFEAVLQGQGVPIDGTGRLVSVESISNTYTRWRLLDQETRTLYAFVLSENEDPIQLHGYTSVARYTWVVSVIHNTLNVTHEDLISVIETLDVVPDRRFATEQPAEVGRLGKSIIIPPRVTL